VGPAFQVAGNSRPDLLPFGLARGNASLARRASWSRCNCGKYKANWTKKSRFPRGKFVEKRLFSRKAFVRSGFHHAAR
jgi:hypothetical protein